MPIEKYTKTDYARFHAETLKTIEDQYKQIKDIRYKIRDNQALARRQFSNSRANIYLDQNVPTKPITGGKTRRKKQRGNGKTRKSRSSSKR